MTTLRERAESCRHAAVTYVKEIAIDSIIHHLREACEEAVREERERIIEKNKPEIDKANAYIKKLEKGGMTIHGGESNTFGVFPDTSKASKGQIAFDHPATEDIQARTAQAIARPTAEDALKAVEKLYGWLAECSAGLRPGKILPEGAALGVGINDLLAGKRDTPAARAITGEAPINSSAKQEGK